MTDSIVTQLARPSEDPGTRAKAVVYLWRTGNLDVLAALGLDGVLEARRSPAPVVASHRQPCPSCGKPLPDPVTNGGRKPCQRRACPDGPTARGVKR